MKKKIKSQNKWIVLFIDSATSVERSLNVKQLKASAKHHNQFTPPSGKTVLFNRRFKAGTALSEL